MENVTNQDENIIKPKNKVWNFIRKVIIVVVVIFIVAVISRAVELFNQKKDVELVKEIHSIRLSLKDVEESNLPPKPDEIINNSTVEGIDVNKNYVRDDVELFIFDKYKTKEERAAWMQYARSMAFVMTKARSKETLKAVMEEGDRADTCALRLYRNREGMTVQIYSNMANEIDNIIANTEKRVLAKKAGYEYMTSSGGMNGQQCDLFKEAD